MKRSFIVLVLLLLLAQAAGATYIKDITFYGKDSVIGYRRLVDTNNVEATVKIDDDPEITASQVFYGSQQFSSCEALTNGAAKCVYNGEESKVAAKKQTFAVILKDDNNETVKSRSSYYYVDNVRPSAKSIIVTPASSGPGNVTVSYHIEDYAIAEGDTSRCTGLKTASVTSGETEVKALEYADNLCIKSESFVIDASELISETGSASICISAFDWFGFNSTPACNSFTADFTAPEINDLVITYTNGSPLSWVRGDEAVDIYVNITEADSGIDAAKVMGTFAELNPELTKAVKADSCRKKGEMYTCVWKGVKLDLNQSATPKLYFNATDKLGNMDGAELSYSVSVDRTSPELVGLQTSYTGDNGTRYIGRLNNTVVASVSEAESGLASVTLSICGKELVTDNCSVACVFENIDCDGPSGPTEIIVSGSDNVGNTFSNSTPAIIDVDAPVISDVWLNTTGALDELNMSILITGDLVTVRAVAYDELSPAIYGYTNFSDIGSEATDGECSVDNRSGKYNCTWISTIEINGPTEASIWVIFEDLTGNKAQKEVKVFVYGLENGTANYWEAHVGPPSPAKIDREMMSVYNAFTFFPINMTPVSETNIWPLYLYVDSCTSASNLSANTTDSSMYLVNTMPELINFNTASQKGTPPYGFYLKYVLEMVVYDNDTLVIPCRLHIVSLIDDERISETEIENITVSLSFYYMPLGTLQDSVVKELDGVADGWLVQQKWLSSAKMILDYSQILCNLVNTWEQIKTLWAGYTDYFAHPCSAGVLMTCAHQKLAAQATAAAKTGTVGIYTMAKRYCQFISCQLSFKDIWKKPNKDTGKEETTTTPTNDKLGELQKAKDPSAYSKIRADLMNQSHRGYFGNIGTPQDSLILSMATFCVPGIVLNLEKARVIDCQYISCLLNTANGQPDYLCKKQRDYAYCKYVLGEVFNFIPFASTLSAISSNIGNALKSPVGLIGFSIDAYCSYSCQVPHVGPVCSACSYVEFANLVADVACDLGITIGQTECDAVWSGITDKVNDDACKTALNDYKEYKEDND